jgi:hypothetical protein
MRSRVSDGKRERSEIAEEDVEKPTSTDALDGDGLGTLCAGGEGFFRRIEGSVEKSID